MTAIPSWVDLEAWTEYMTMRQRIKKPMTPRVIRQKLKLLQEFHDKGHDVNAVIDAATNGNWLDFYEPRERVITDKRPSAAISRNAELERQAAQAPADPAIVAKTREKLAELVPALRRVA